VEVELPVAELLVLLDPPVMWNGKEYWKMEGSVMLVILKPYVAKAAVAGTAQVYLPAELSSVVMVSPRLRVAGSAPWRRAIETDPTSVDFGVQVISKDDPAGTS